MDQNKPNALTENDRLAQENLDLLDRLLAGWTQVHDRQEGSWTFGQRGERPHVARFASIYALTAHAHALIDFVRPRLSREDIPFSILQVRQAYECALTATWMALNRESAFAMFNEEIRRNRSVKLTIGKSRQFSEHVELPASPEPLENVSSLPQARNFNALCEDLEPDGATLYLMYRIVSKYCHAGPFVIDQYMTPTEDSAQGQGEGDATGQMDDIEALHRLPLRPGMDTSMTTFIAGASLILAGRAVDFIDPARTRRSELRAAARELGIPPELHLSPQARQRIEEAEKRRRHANRQRPLPTRDGM